ncbi:MAG TPA: L-seryl-tRNA(Sec) selenium transferase, partial [Micromonosporaceae bacterium]|nr:L-seryl-tRNA(Sec) selenium transferase [Micromonosporaceae bacterium]
MSDTFRRVPRTDVLLADERLTPATVRLGRTVVKAAVRRAQAKVRRGEVTPD